MANVAGPTEGTQIPVNVTPPNVTPAEAPAASEPGFFSSVVTYTNDKIGQVAGFFIDAPFTIYSGVKAATVFTVIDPSIWVARTAYGAAQVTDPYFTMLSGVASVGFLLKAGWDAYNEAPQKVIKQDLMIAGACGGYAATRLLVSNFVLPYFAAEQKPDPVPDPDPVPVKVVVVETDYLSDLYNGAINGVINHPWIAGFGGFMSLGFVAKRTFL